MPTIQNATWKKTGFGDDKCAFSCSRSSSCSLSWFCDDLISSVKGLDSYIDKQYDNTLAELGSIISTRTLSSAGSISVSMAPAGIFAVLNVFVRLCVCL